MCQSSCGGLFKKGVKLSEVTCPCKRGYWDMFKLTFIDGDMIDDGFPPREEYIKEVKKRLSPEEYESRIRVQGFIRHFLTCPVKSAIDKKTIREGKNDGSSLRKALTEWREFQEGDYKSHGSSRILDANTLASILESIQGHRVSPEDFEILAGAQKSSDEQRILSSSYDTRQSTISSPKTKSSRHAAASNRTKVTGDRAEDTPSSAEYFIPETGLRLDVLNDHCGLGTFGSGAVVRAENRHDGKRGFVVKGTKKPTVDTIRMLVLESEKRVAATEDRRKIDTRTFGDDKNQTVTSRHQSSDRTAQTSFRSYSNSRSGLDNRHAHEIKRNVSDARQSSDAKQSSNDRHISVGRPSSDITRDPDTGNLSENRQISNIRYASNPRHATDTPYDSRPRYASNPRRSAAALARDMGIMKIDARDAGDITNERLQEGPRSLNSSSRASKHDEKSESLTRSSDLDSKSSARRTWSSDDSPNRSSGITTLDRTSDRGKSPDRSSTWDDEPYRRVGRDYPPVHDSGGRADTGNTQGRRRDTEEDSELRRPRIDRHGSSISDRRKEKGGDQGKGRHD